MRDIFNIYNPWVINTTNLPMKIKKIAYHTPQIDVRGSCTALYDYAVNMKKFYGISAIIVYAKKGSHDDLAIQKFSKTFPIHMYDSVIEIDDIIQREKCDYLYCIKYGTCDDIQSSIVPTGIHCVFDMSQPHGTVYVAVSETLANKYSKPGEFVPHMISLKPSTTHDNMREQLNIPLDAIVFGRHGGTDTFNLPFVRDIIKAIVRMHKNIYFVFVNTPIFDVHTQVIFLDKIIDNDIKNKFIHTCDAHIEAGSLGHTFGISIAEFMINGKPVIAYDAPNLWNRAHLDILEDKAHIFHNQNEFYDIITSFTPYIIEDNPYNDYLPEQVCKQFYDKFIKPCEE